MNKNRKYKQMEETILQLKKNLWNIFINLLHWNTEEKEDSTCVNLLAISVLEMDDIVLLSKEKKSKHSFSYTEDTSQPFL